MQFSGNGSSLALGLGAGGESPANRGQQPPDLVWDLSNNPNYGFLGHVPNVGQLGLSRLCAVNEFRKATITPHVLRVHSVVEYHRVQDEPGVTLPLFHGTGEVSVAEIARPYYPHALLHGNRLVLSMERRDYLQNTAPLLGDPPTDNNVDIPNEADKHPKFPTITERIDPFSQPKVDENPTADYYDEPIDAEPLRVYAPDDVCDRNNILRPKVETNNDSDWINIDTTNAGNLNVDSIVMNVRRRNNKRTRSVPYRKYGPYTCPRCTGVFPTSQSFAAHVSAHYRKDGDGGVREPIVSILNTGRKRGRPNRRSDRHIPYIKPGPYPCARCNTVLETPSMFAAHVTSHYREEVIRGLSGEAANGPEREIPTPNPLEEAEALVPMVDWLSMTLKKVLSRRRKRSSSENIDVPTTTPTLPPSPSSSSPSPPETSAVKMEFDPKENYDDEVVEVDAFEFKIKKEPWST